MDLHKAPLRVVIPNVIRRCDKVLQGSLGGVPIIAHAQCLFTGKSLFIHVNLGMGRLKDCKGLKPAFSNI